MSPPPPQPTRHSPPALVDDVIAEILLRLPPDDPARLVRASLVCKPWRRLLSGPAFLGRYRAFHRRLPMLGFLNWYALDSRHGRALFHDFLPGEVEPTGLIVWDPVTEGQWGVPLPTSAKISWNAAVLCAADGCDHLDCRDGPFRVVFVGTDDEGLTSACVYSSEAGAWSDKTSIEHPDAIVEMWPSVLVGNTVYFPCEPSTRIVEYDMGEQELTVIDVPFACQGRTVLMSTEDDVLGFASVQESRL